MTQNRIAVVAHTDRLERATLLAKTIGAHNVLLDDGTLGCLENHKLAWQWHTKQHVTWSVVIEDDALPVNDFQNQLELALNAAPTPIVSLYLGQKRPHEFQQRIGAALINATARQNAHWILAEDCIHAVGVAIHQNLTASLCDYLNTPRFGPQEIDYGISMWARMNNHPVAYTVPSLLDHDDTLPVLAEHDSPRTPGRTAWTTGTRPQWNSNTVPL